MLRKVKNFVEDTEKALAGYSAFGLTEPILNDIVVPNITLNSRFAIGLGKGIGQSLPFEMWQLTSAGSIDYDSDSSARDKSEQAATLEQLFAFDGFSFGAGLAFSSIMVFMTEQTRTSILQLLLPKYQKFAFGLGCGADCTFPWMDQK